MSELKLPGGGKPWFVRVRSRANYRISPCSREGWLVVGGYTLFVLLLTPLLLNPTKTRAILYVALFAVSSAIFWLVTLRMSVAQPREETSGNSKERR